MALENNHKSEGFTLLEIIISVVILATVSILITQVLFTTTRVNTKSGVIQDIKQNGDFALDVMSRLIRASATNITTCDVGQLTSPSMTLQTDQNTTITFQCKSDGVSARIASVSASGTYYLTGSDVTVSATGGKTCDVSSLTFSCPAAPGVPGPVIIQFSLGPLGGDPTTFATAKTSFETTVSPRN